MSLLIESLKRLYKANKITLEQLQERVEKGIITKEQLEEITSN